MRRKDILQTITALAAISVLGGGFAAAAIRTAPPELTVNLSMRTLSSAPGLRLTPTFGADDEDCVTATRRVPSADGQAHEGREVVCRQ